VKSKKLEVKRVRRQNAEVRRGVTAKAAKRREDFFD
jgi:hypothetical protein